MHKIIRANSQFTPQQKCSLSTDNFLEIEEGSEGEIEPDQPIHISYEKVRKSLDFTQILKPSPFQIFPFSYSYPSPSPSFTSPLARRYQNLECDYPVSPGIEEKSTFYCFESRTECVSGMSEELPKGILKRKEKSRFSFGSESFGKRQKRSVKFMKLVAESDNIKKRINQTCFKRSFTRLSISQE